MTTPEGQAVASRLTAWLRTVLPGAWAALVAWLVGIGVIPADWSIHAIAALQATLGTVAVAAVYPLMRQAEPHLPRWLVLAFLGSDQRPVYVPPAVEEKVEQGRELTVTAESPIGRMVRDVGPDELRDEGFEDTR